ncbi:MAG: glycosyltransferase family 4 protein [Limisphaerales bacterium]
MDKTSNVTLKILLMGPQGKLIGGDTIPFRQTVDTLLKRSDIEVKVLDTYGVRGKGWNTFPCLFVLLVRMFMLAKWCDVICLYANASGIPFIGPFVVCAARFWRRPIIFRQIGGMHYNAFSRPKAAIIRWTITRCRLHLVESKELKRLADEDGMRHTKWYPNCRLRPPVSGILTRPDKCSGRFVFVGRLLVSKGLQILVEAVEASDVKMEVHVYGPWYDLPRGTFDGCKRVFYKGELAPEEVIPCIEKYDALLLPTFHPSEGYPGVVLEAYHARRPVIASRWKAVPELVIHDETGLLVEPRNAISLQQAMQLLVQSPALYQKLGAGASQFGERFSFEALCNDLVGYCRQHPNASSI